MTDNEIYKFFHGALDSWLLDICYINIKANCYNTIKIELPQEVISRIPHIQNLVFKYEVNKDNTVVQMWNGIQVTFTSSLKCKQ